MTHPIGYLTPKQVQHLRAVAAGAWTSRSVVPGTYSPAFGLIRTGGHPKPHSYKTALFFEENGYLTWENKRIDGAWTVWDAIITPKGQEALKCFPEQP